MSPEKSHKGTQLLSEEDDHRMQQSKGIESEDEPKVDPMASGECRKQKKARSTLVHNFTEKLRRRRIKEKIKCLQELVPNCSRRDKASVLDDTIKYIKNLQYQLQIMSMPQGYTMSHVACMMQSPPMNYPDPGVQLPSLPPIFQHTRPPGIPGELFSITPQAWDLAASPVLGGTSEEDITIPEHDFVESLLALSCPSNLVPFLGTSFPLGEPQQMPVTSYESSPFP